MRLKNILLTFLFALPIMVWAQVTTGTLTGVAKNDKGEALSGATITAVHLPTGSKYSTVAKSGGQYTIPNLRVGGPYTITIHFTGYGDAIFNDLNIGLGTPLIINGLLTSSSQSLSGVTVVGNAKGSIISAQKIGTSTYLSSRLMQSVPTISRSIQDFARLTPQAKVGNSASTGDGAGVSFGGQNSRYNQFSVDGANASDGFGLAGSGTNGGQAGLNPISTEVIQEMQIVLSPYDVSQGGFTGGGINAVTKSGSNTFHGVAYGQYQNQGFVGKNPAYDASVTRTPYANFNNQTFGASLSGALIKNKLFFYVNAERFKKSTPLAFDPTNPGSGSKVSTAVLDSISNYLKNTLNYDPGTYGAINAERQSTSFFGRLDWNISDKHKLVLRFNHVDGTSDNISRTATSSLFSNGGFIYRDNTNSAVAELNSTFSSSVSNILRLTYSSIKDNNGSKSPFPNVTLYQTNAATAANIVYNIGTNISYGANGLTQNVFTLTDNFTLYKGKHTLTFGTNNEFFNSNNIFLQNYLGTYTYGASASSASPNVASFYNNATPTTYAVGYSTSADKNDKANAILHAAQFSVYGQDVVAITDHFKLTYGLRIDMPVFFNKPDANTAFNTAFSSYGVSTNQLPKSQPLYSPRIGFNWDVEGDGSLQLRGGAGLFTGRVPFVWISNQMSNTGVASLGYSALTQALVAAAGIKFKYDPTDSHLGAYIPSSSTPVASTINVIDKNFKFPQVLRGNIAADKKLNIWGLVSTFELIYSKTLNNVNYTNLNLSDNGEGTVAVGTTTRPLWTKFQNTSYKEVLELTNTNKGYSASFTAQIQKPYSKGWSGSLAYTYGTTSSLSDATSSVALSNWKGVLTTNGLNKLDLATSNYDMGSRIVGYLSKEFRYSKNFATNITLIYTGQSGQKFSYIYNGNLLGDDLGSTSTFTNLAYVPATAAAANFVDIKGGATAAQQWTDFQTFASNNTYLQKNAGQNSTRNGDKMPFENHFDLRISQDLILGKNKLQIFFDVINLGNLLNQDWGRSYSTSTTGDGLFTATSTLFIVQRTGAQTQNGAAVTATAANPYYQFNINNFTKIGGIAKAYGVADFTSRWNSQVGVRYSF